MDVDPALASTLQVIAEGVIEFAGFNLAAVSLVSDGVLHTVAVVGDDDAAERLMDLRAPVELLERELEGAEVWGSLRFVPAERAGNHLDGHNWVPDIVALDVKDSWDPEDLLCGLLRDGDGRLRGLLSVDLPVSGMRPGLAQRETLQMYVQLAERALVTTLERGDLVVRVEQEHAIAEYRRSIIDALSHELRGTAAAITNTVEVLRDRVDLDTAMSSGLGVVDGAAERIRSVVDDMSALTKLGRSDVLLRSMPTNLGVVARDAIALESAGARLHGVAVHLDVGESVIVLGDPEDLDRLIGNLVSNAIKYSEPGGRVDVRIRSLPTCDKVPRTVRLTVTDVGLGIGSDDLERVFDEFFRSRDDAVRRRSGAGLGLAIVDRIVALHGGSIRVDSALGEGSTFTVDLPHAPIGESGN